MLFILRDSWNLMTRNVTDVQLILSLFFSREVNGVFSIQCIEAWWDMWRLCLSIYLSVYMYIYIYIDIGISEAFIENFCLLGTKNMLRFCLIHCCKKVTPLLLLYISCVRCAFWSWISEICTFSQKMKNRNWTSILILQLCIHHDQFVWLFNLSTI